MNTPDDVRELRPGAWLQLRDTPGLWELVDVIHWKTSPFYGGIRHVELLNVSDASKLTVTGPKFREGWRLARRAPDVPTHPPTSVPTPARAVLAHIERIMRRQDHARQRLERAAHFTLCAGCTACNSLR